jgi:hypothetical protein
MVKTLAERHEEINGEVRNVIFNKVGSLDCKWEEYDPSNTKHTEQSGTVFDVNLKKEGSMKIFVYSSGSCEVCEEEFSADCNCRELMDALGINEVSDLWHYESKMESWRN